MAKIEFLQVRDVKAPTRGTELSAGIDFYVPNDFPGVISLLPGEAVNIPSGLKVKLPHCFCLWMCNKSGVAVKKGLQVGAEIIDEDYQGEIHLHIRNISNDVQMIKPGEKIVQGLLVPVLYSTPVIVSDMTTEEFFGKETQRGENGFGSTGTE